MNKLRVGIVGLGRMGRRHLRVLSERDDVSIAWTVDPVPSERVSWPHFSELEAALALGADVIVVSTPTRTHASVATLALAGGRVVLVEKPLATTSDEAELLLFQAREVGAKLAVGHVERFNPAVIAVRDLLIAGRLGAPLALSFRRVGLPPVGVVDVDVLSDLAVHDLDVCAMLCGSDLEIVAALGWPGSGLTESAQILCRAGQIGITLQVNWKTPIRIREFTLTTDECLVDVNYTTQVVEVAEPVQQVEFARFAGFQSHYGAARSVRLPVSVQEPLAGQADALVALASGASETVLATGEDGLRAVRLAERARRFARSARTGSSGESCD